MIFKTVFISDVHLGSSHCNVEAFLSFLKNNEFQNLYLCGDIFDFFVLKTSFFWTESFNTVIQKLLRKARQGVKIFYIPGNHDALFRKFNGYKFGNVSICNEIIYTTLRDKKIKITHGDEFDLCYRGKQFLYYFGCILYSFALFLDKHLRKINTNFSFSFFLKRKIKNVFERITNYHIMMYDSIRKSKVDGIISGHTHLPDLCVKNNVIMGNCGCWMADTINTCIIEDYNGDLKLLTINKKGEIINEKILTGNG
jgi:UDP-2,3-diacylglucosamine pyrophosphatase LpxH